MTLILWSINKGILYSNELLTREGSRTLARFIISFNKVTIIITTFGKVMTMLTPYWLVLLTGSGTLAEERKGICVSTPVIIKDA